MATTQRTSPITLTVTEQAAVEVRKFIAEEKVSPDTAGLRIAVLPGGCSGFKYSLNIEDKPAEDDLVIETGGVRCFVDAFSAQYLNGVTLNRSEEHTSELQSPCNLVCRLLLEKKKHI